MQNKLIQRLQLVEKYLQRMTQEEFEILDLNMLESFYLADKAYHPSQIVIERNYELQAIRSDWTRSIYNYKQQFHLNNDKYAYFGPVIRSHQTIYQAGIEMYHQSPAEIIRVIEMHLQFIQEFSQKTIQTVIVNHEAIIDLYLEKYQLAASLKELLYDKNISALKEQLGSNHPLYQLMIIPVSQQINQIQQTFPDHPTVTLIEELKNKVQKETPHFILDLSFRSPQAYYNGFYIQAFLDQNSPALSGGQYATSAFGMALNLSKGGII